MHALLGGDAFNAGLSRGHHLARAGIMIIGMENSSVTVFAGGLRGSMLVGTTGFEGGR